MLLEPQGTIRNIEENSTTLLDIEAKEIFKNETLLSKKVDAKMSKRDYSKLRSFCIPK